MEWIEYPPQRMSGGIVIVRRPILTEEQREARVAQVKKALIAFARAVEEQKEKANGI